MASLTLDTFRGMAPKFEPLQLPQGYAAQATQCSFEQRQLKPLYKATTLGYPAAAWGETSVGDFYMYPLSNSATAAVCWSERQNVLEHLLPDDAYGRLYFTGEVGGLRGSCENTGHPTLPRQLITDGASLDDVANSYAVGVPAPNPITALAVSQPTWLNDEAPEDFDEAVWDPTFRYYTYTFVNDFGEESAPWVPKTGSLPGVEVYEGQHVAVAGFEDRGFTDLVPVRYVRLYRTNLDGDYQQVADIDYAVAKTSGFVDTVADIELGPLMVSQTWDTPPAEMRGLVMHPSGFMVGFYNNTVHVSEVGYYYAWPQINQVNVNEPIRQLAVVSQGVLALTTGTPYLITGVDPSSLQVINLAGAYPALSYYGAAVLNDVCYYITSEGIAATNGGGVVLATESLFDTKTWQQTMGDLKNAHVYAHEQSLVIKTDTKLVLFTPHDSDSAWVELDPDEFTFTAARTDADTAALHYVDTDSKVQVYQGASTPQTYTYRSRTIHLPHPLNYTALRVHCTPAESFELTLLDGNDNELYKRSFTPTAPVIYDRLPLHPVGFDYSIKLVGSTPITSVSFAGAFREFS